MKNPSKSAEWGLFQIFYTLYCAGPQRAVYMYCVGLDSCGIWKYYHCRTHHLSTFYFNPWLRWVVHTSCRSWTSWWMTAVFTKHFKTWIGWQSFHFAENYAAVYVTLSSFLFSSFSRHWQLHAHYYPPLLRSATVRAGTCSVLPCFTACLTLTWRCQEELGLHLLMFKVCSGGRCPCGVLVDTEYTFCPLLALYLCRWKSSWSALRCWQNLRETWLLSRYGSCVDLHTLIQFDCAILLLPIIIS